MEQVGSGAMGVVWQAQDERLDRTVAIKRLLVRYAVSDEQSEETRRRAMREARIAARLQHRNAIAMFDVVEDEGDPCLIMEFLPSRSLSAVLAERGTLPPGEVAEIGAQVASALAAAHAVGIVHRDIKPGNILLADNGMVKITDFGISKALDDGTVTTQTGIAGTPAYLAPEIARGEDPSRASDVFSLGSTLYHAVEGRPPFGANSNPLALLHAVASGNVDPPRNAGQLADTLSNLMRPDPTTRPSMREAASALAKPTSAPTKPTKPVKPPVRNNKPAPADPPPPPRPVAVLAQPAPPPNPPNAANPTATINTANGVPNGTTALPAPPPPRTTDPARRNMMIVAVAALLVVASVVAGILLLNDDKNPAGNASQGGTSTQTSRPEPPQQQESSSQPPSTGENKPIPADAPIPYSDAGVLVIAYYGDVGNTAGRFAMLSTNAQGLFGDIDAFRTYWAQFSQVSSQTARVVKENPDGSLDVQASVTYTKGDSPSTQTQTVRVTRVNGKLVIDSKAI